jgi:hypothetical protein
VNNAHRPSTNNAGPKVCQTPGFETVGDKLIIFLIFGLPLVTYLVCPCDGMEGRHGISFGFILQKDYHEKFI